MSKKKVVVIGAGASGMLAAGRAAGLGAMVTLLEKMDRPCSKILASGSGRCNLSNIKGRDDFISAYGVNGRFLYTAFHCFFRQDLLKLLLRYGVQASVERDGRIFPSSGQSSDVASALVKYVQDCGVKMITGARVKKIEVKRGHINNVQIEDNTRCEADAVVLATGGSSYPQTGSSGDGYKIAGALGHTIIKLRPALVPLIVKETSLVQALQGISLKDVRVTSLACCAEEIDTRAIPQKDTGRSLAGQNPHPPIIESRTGDVLFTHFGISGPCVLLMSLAVVNASDSHPVSISINLFPKIAGDQLGSKLKHEFTAHGSKAVKNVLGSLVPAKLAALVLNNSGVAPAKKASQISAAERNALSMALKDIRFNIRGPRPLSQAMVTAGGVCLDEVNPRTLESRLVKGLYFCGEVLDIDADTGGFNLQAAFSTGYLAGESAAKQE